MPLINTVTSGQSTFRGLCYVALVGNLFFAAVNACSTSCSIDVFFSGNYTDETCNVAINNASSNEIVTLARVAVASLSRDGNETGSVPFDITLNDCPANRTITLFFNSGISAADTATGNLVNNSGTELSRNVQIRLRKENSSQVIIDSADSGQDYVISSTAEPLSHRFTASYYAKGNSTVTAGQVHAMAGIELVYK